MISPISISLQSSVSSALRQAATAASTNASLQTSPSIDSSTQENPLAPSSTQVSISAQGLAASLADANSSNVDPTLALRDYDPNSVVNKPTKAVSVDYKAGEVERQRLNEIYLSAPIRKASDATFSLANRMAALQKTIDKSHPELNQTSWDFVLKDGKLQVTGNVSANDKKWLEHKLNGDPQMVQAAKDLYSSAVTTYQYTTENSSLQDIGYGTHGYFDKVADQINGKISMRSLVKSELGVDALHGVFKSGTRSDGLVQIARQYLSVSNTPPVLATADGTASTATT
jgi:hypothetical protein